MIKMVDEEEAGNEIEGRPLSGRVDKWHHSVCRKANSSVERSSKRPSNREGLGVDRPCNNRPSRLTEIKK